MINDSYSDRRILIMDDFATHPMANRNHAALAFPTESLRRIEEILPAEIESSVETGCGKSTILFSNVASRHKVFTLDDRSFAESSVTFFQECSLPRNERIEVIFGPTQKTLPGYSFNEPFDVILIDGPHSYPFPEIEYYFLYQHIKRGGYLIIDDLVIPTIGRLADFIAEDDMFELVEIVGCNTAIFRRTDAPTFDPTGDGWWLHFRSTIGGGYPPSAISF